MSIGLNVSGGSFYSNTRYRPGPLGRAVVGYLGKELANLPFKSTAEDFNRDLVAISKGIKRLEKRIRDDEEIAKTIRKLREYLTKNKTQYSFS